MSGSFDDFDDAFDSAGPGAHGTGGFGGQVVPQAVVFSGPPFGWLLGGMAAVAIGVCIAWIWGSLPLAVAGWVLAGPVGLTLVAWFVNRDNRARSSGVYLAPAWTAAAYWVCVGLSLVGVIAVAVRIADGVGRL